MAFGRELKSRRVGSSARQQIRQGLLPSRFAQGRLSSEEGVHSRAENG